MKEKKQSRIDIVTTSKIKKYWKEKSKERGETLTEVIHKAMKREVGNAPLTAKEIEAMKN